MVGEILMGILGVAFLLGAYKQFHCVGPVWSAEYIAASPKDKRKMQTKSEYYWSAIGCLYIGILFLLSLAYSMVEVKPVLYVIFVLCGFFSCTLCMGFIVLLRKAL